MTGSRPTDRRQFLYGGMLLGAGALGLALRLPAAAVFRPDDLARSIPARIGRYRHAAALGVVLPPQDELSAQIYQQYLARVYAAAGVPPVMLVIAYGGTQDYGLQLHRPETCYPASGFVIGETRATTLALAGRAVGVTTLTATRPGRREQILYWTRIGDAFPDGFWVQRAAIMRAVLHGRLPDGALVRLSVIGTDPAAATAQLAGFAAALVTDAEPAGRALMLGPAR